MSIEKSLTEFVASTGYEHLPQKVVEAVKGLIMNTFAAMLCGSGASGAKELAQLARRWSGVQESAVFLQNFKAPTQDAVLVNATMARALDFDDFHMQTGMHASATVVPIALATAEAMGRIDGKTLITAIAIGAEILCRMRLVPDHCIGISGWTGEIYGAFGGAVTAGRICGLSGVEMGHALGLAYSQAAGNAQTIYDGALGTRLQQGLSARAGCVSAAMAKAGLTGAKNFLEGKAGLYPVYYRGLGYDINRLTEGLGEKYEILNIAAKPYPCCGFIMAPIENVLRIMRENRLVAGDIKKVVFSVNQKMYNTVCFPPDTKYQPQTPADAMFSLPYVVATAIIKGDVSLSDFSDEAIKNAERLTIARNVEIEIDEGIEEESTELNLSLSLHQVELKTEGGQHFSRKMYHAKGFPQNPMTMADFTEKAKKCALYAVKLFPESRVEELEEVLVHLEDKEDISSLIKLLF